MDSIIWWYGEHTNTKVLSVYVGGSVWQIVVYCDKCMSRMYLVFLKQIDLVLVHQLSHHRQVTFVRCLQQCCPPHLP